MKILAPISIGELYDKISILEIKSDVLFNDREKANNVDKELKELREISIKYPIGLDLYNQLKTINKRIWDIEDRIRECERDKHFHERFKDLARAVYFNNDERAAIKKKINVEFGSEIIEEKSYEKYE
jgi:hypothetical protein